MSKTKQFQPDLVILDLGLPAGDGISTLQRLRANASFSHVQVLVLSARRASEWRDTAIQQGANACLQKPVDKQTLLFQVQPLLGPSPAPALPAGSQISCPHCGGSLSGMKFGLDEATIDALARNVQRNEPTR